MADKKSLRSRQSAEISERRRRIGIYVLVIVSFIFLFVISIRYAQHGPGISQINADTPDKTSNAQRFGFTNSWINPAYRKPTE